MRELNLDDEIARIIVFIKGELAEVGYDKILVGLSGGIDSSVVAALCVKAIGKKNVIGVMMPYRESHPDSLAHAKEVAAMLEIQYDIINISPMVDSYFEKYAPNADFLRRGNRIARERMCVLYDLSAKYKALVAGTGNKSELMVGYCTQYGDNACAFETIGHLYKNEVRKIAKILNISQEIINKNPSADLWENQTDEVEMGISYSRLDEILYNLIDFKKSKKEIKKLGFSQDEIGKVQQMIKNSEFKRRIPPILKLI